ncbi:hypothetical protein ACN263_01330 [Micromonospora sp. WMMD729]|uniref:hypothetical protein n=1 Tax=Micromonospora sp. WMMD729 TaxID=3404127 RepID=UPI003BF58F64
MPRVLVVPGVSGMVGLRGVSGLRGVVGVLSVIAGRLGHDSTIALRPGGVSGSTPATLRHDLRHPGALVSIVPR